MRSFLIALLALSLPLSILASHSDHRARRHAEIALRARGDISPRLEFNGVRITFYDITAGTYVSSFYSCLSLPYQLSVVQLVAATTRKVIL
jgi:hypothetical protein